MQVSEDKSLNVSLVITEACNLRCIMCDYWKQSNPRYMSLEFVQKLAPILLQHKIRNIMLTGGEPLLHPQWVNIADVFAGTARIYMCTSGYLIKKYIGEISERITRLVVSIDSISAENFKLIRGVARPDLIWTYLRQLKESNSNVEVFLKMVIQKKNFFEIDEFLDGCLNKPWINKVGFTVPDFSEQAFAHKELSLSNYSKGVLLNEDECEKFSAIVEQVYEKYSAQFRDGYIFEGDLRRFDQRFRSLVGLCPPPDGRNCKIPTYKFIFYPDGAISGCYFLPSDKKIVSLSDFNESEFDDLLSRRQNFDSTCNSHCQKCDQLMFSKAQ
jgi:MoaA/NifB/PqqE/SkfB family radical SAM enzyme